jgi:uncharacterized protein YjbJ (UPF0337 family)
MAKMQSEGTLDRLRGRIRSTWGDVTDDDIERSKGNPETLVGTIKSKTGEAAESVRQKLNQLLREGDGTGAP